MRRPAGWVAVVVLLLALGKSSRAEHEPRRAWGGLIGFEQSYNDNVQQSANAARQGDFISTLSVLATWEPAKRRWLLLPTEAELWLQAHVYDHYRDFTYVELRPEVAYRLGYGVDAVLGYLYAPRRLLFEEDAASDQVFYREHAVTAGFRGKLGERKQLRTQLLFRGVWTDYFGSDRPRDAWSPELRWDLAYRIDLWARRLELVPRIGVIRATRDARRDNYNREVVEVVPGFDLRLPGAVLLRFRYERTWRDYTVDELRDGDGHRNNNFNRTDDYDQLLTWVVVPLPWDGVTLRPRYRYRDGVFKEPSQRQQDGTVGQRVEFSVHEVGMELLYTF
jgi:hypothetical protein